MTNSNQNAQQAEHTEQAPAEQGQITPELIREVTDKVYALWQRELQIERERSRQIRPLKRR